MLGRILHSPLAVREARAVPESDDEELLPGLQRRDPHAIAKLYDLYGIHDRYLSREKTLLPALPRRI